ncbi:MAG TPA: ribbon-helix-helix domain-containing protein [Ktedonobacterales bacterium]|nr:ribbon-helix-helix domain-containing protein [Ktedonobacterales bacterium]
MVGNKNSGRRDRLPRGGGRPRTRLTVHIATPYIEQLDEIAEAEHTTIVDVVRTALLEYIEAWQVKHDSQS